MRRLFSLVLALSLLLAGGVALAWARSYAGGVDHLSLTVGGVTYGLAAWEGTLRASRTVYLTTQTRFVLGPPPSFVTVRGVGVPPPAGLAYEREEEPPLGPTGPNWIEWYTGRFGFGESGYEQATYERLGFGTNRLDNV